MLTPPPYPASRPRRLRRDAWSRELVRELSWLLGYEAMADPTTQPTPVETPLESMAGAPL